MADMTLFEAGGGTPEFLTLCNGQGFTMFELGFVPELTVPVVANVTPPAGVAIDKTAAIGFDVTDAAGNLKRANVYAYFPSLQRFEVVYFSGAISGAWGSRSAGFGPGYGGTRSVITNGYRFSGVVRTGGWPAPPVIVTDPIDSAGNEAA